MKNIVSKKLVSVAFTGFLAVCMGLVFVSSIAAQESEEGGGAGERKYGQAGCGLGSLWIGASGNQIFASTTNGTLGNQTFGITSGTSNCADDAVLKAEVEQKIFVFQNYEELENSVARGRGESLVSLAYLMGCSADSVDAFGSVTQAHYTDIFENGAEKNRSDMVLGRVKSVLSNNKELSASCSRL